MSKLIVSVNTLYNYNPFLMNYLCLCYIDNCPCCSMTMYHTLWNGTYITWDTDGDVSVFAIVALVKTLNKIFNWRCSFMIKSKQIHVSSRLAVTNKTELPYYRCTTFLEGITYMKFKSTNAKHDTRCSSTLTGRNSIYENYQPSKIHIL